MVISHSVLEADASLNTCCKLQGQYVVAGETHHETKFSWPGRFRMSESVVNKAESDYS